MGKPNDAVLQESEDGEVSSNASVTPLCIWLAYCCVFMASRLNIYSYFLISRVTIALKQKIISRYQEIVSSWDSNPQSLIKVRVKRTSHYTTTPLCYDKMNNNQDFSEKGVWRYFCNRRVVGARAGLHQLLTLKQWKSYSIHILPLYTIGGSITLRPPLSPSFLLLFFFSFFRLLVRSVWVCVLYIVVLVMCLCVSVLYGAGRGGGVVDVPFLFFSSSLLSFIFFFFNFRKIKGKKILWKRKETVWNLYASWSKK